MSTADTHLSTDSGSTNPSSVVLEIVGEAQSVRSLLPQLKPEHVMALTGIQHPDIARAILTNPRMAQRYIPHVRPTLGLPPHAHCPARLYPLLNARFFYDAALKIGLMLNLRRFGTIIMKRDLISLEQVYGADTLDFALKHIRAAPPTAVQERIPAAAFDTHAARKVGAKALTAWAVAHFAEESKWLESIIDLPPITDLTQAAPRLVAMIDRVAPDLGLAPPTHPPDQAAEAS